MSVDRCSSKGERSSAELRAEDVPPLSPGKVALTFQVDEVEALRKQVEGPYHDPGTAEAPPTYGGYAQAVEAEQVVGVVGASNMYAAYFLGEIELIGGSP